MSLLEHLDFLELNVLIGLSLISVVGWFISTLSGGGSALLIMPVVGLLLGARAIPPVTTVGAIVGNTDRFLTYREQVRWQVIYWEAPGAILGSCLGAFILTRLRVEYLGAIVGIFLLLSALSFFGKKDTERKTFQVKAWYFLPAGFIYSTLSGIIGSMGPLLLPFYLNFGLEKETLLGTQAANRMVVHLTKLVAYLIFGLLTPHYFIYGILMGLCAIPGNWMGNLVLKHLSEQQFRQVVMTFVLCSGLLMMWQNLV